MKLIASIRFCCSPICLLFCVSVQLAFGATITYQEDTTTNFKNPERGNRNGTETLNRVYYDISPYRTVTVLPKSALDNFRNDCAIYRSKGQKIIPRWRYAWTSGGDAPLQTMLGHIEQIGAVIRENADVVALVEAGFLGCFGEWHYYNCTDAYKNDNLTSRRAVLFKLLDVMPKDRMVVLRYNRHKRDIFGSNIPLGPDSAFSGSNRARTGGQNDCFRYSADDRGTYNQPPWNESIDSQKTFLSLDNRYVPQEGETCGSSSFSVCDSAIKDFKRMHWDGIGNYHMSGQWSTGGCLNYIYMHWGYRLVLRNASLPDSVRPGGAFSGSINLQNVGWGKIYNPRGCELVFQHSVSGAKTMVKLDNDPRRWCMTEAVVNVPLVATLPSMSEGTYKLYLNLPDPYPSLHDRKEYSIRLANNNVWEDATGYNSLLHNVVVSLKVNTRIAKAIPGLYTLRVTKNSGIIKFTYGKFASPTPLTLEVFSLSGAKLWSRAVTAGVSGEQTISWKAGSSGIHLVKLSFGEGRSSANASGAVRTVVFKL